MSVSDGVNVRVRLFAGMRERLGKSEIAVSLPGDADIAALQRLLAAEYPALNLDQQRFTITVNRSFACPIKPCTTATRSP